VAVTWQWRHQSCRMRSQLRRSFNSICA